MSKISHNLNATEILKLLNEIELNFSVNEWSVNGYYIWPLIRIQVAAFLRNYNYEGQRTKKHNQLSFLKSIKSIWRSFRSEILINPNNFRDIDIVTFSIGNGKFKVGEKFYNPYGDPIITEGISEKLSMLHVERDKKNACILPRYSKVLYLNYGVIRWINAVMFKIYSIIKKPHYDLPGFIEVVNKIEQDTGRAILSEELVKKLFRWFIGFRLFYIFVLKYIKPKLAIVTCYYAMDSFGIISACKKLRIPVADYQHGIQGSKHYAYGPWYNMPKEEYSLLPDYFFTWDSSSAESINAWNKSDGVEKGIAIGNLIYEDTEMLQHFERQKSKIELQSAKKIILFTFQDYIPEDWIFDTINACGEGYLWIIRFHPLHRDIQTEIESRLKDMPLTNIDFDIGNTLPLSILLGYIDVHVTGNSSVVDEALSFGKRSIIFDEYACDYYNSYIEDKTVFFVRNSEEFMHHLLQMENLASIYVPNKNFITLHKLFDTITQ